MSFPSPGLFFLMFSATDSTRNCLVVIFMMRKGWRWDHDVENLKDYLFALSARVSEVICLARILTFKASGILTNRGAGWQERRWHGVRTEGWLNMSLSGFEASVWSWVKSFYRSKGCFSPFQRKGCLSVVEPVQSHALPLSHTPCSLYFFFSYFFLVLIGL